jgi:predicted DsbA family dithiol-disulfide isomerase
MARLDVYSDVICPWCYIGKRHMQVALGQLAADGHEFEISWRPFQLNPDMPAGGIPRDEYRQTKFGSLERSRELDAQVGSAAAAAGLQIRFDLMQRTPNTLDAHRLIQFAAERRHQDEIVDSLFAAYFVEGRDIGDRATLVEIAAGAGLDPVETAAFLHTDDLAAEIQAEDAGVRQAGLSGVPTFVLDRHVLFSGAVPPDAFAEALLKAQRVIANQAA